MLGTNGKIRTLISFITIFALILMSFPSMAVTTHDFQQTYTIFAGKTMDVGDATFTVDGNQLTIDVTLNENCVAEEYHLHILDSLPEDRPAPGSDPFTMKVFDEPVNTFKVGPLDVPIGTLEPGQCDELYFVFHLVTKCCQELELRCNCEEPCKSETAYAGTIVDPKNGSWFGYVKIEFCNDEEEEFGSLQIFKFEDEENRGTYDQGEKPLSGIQFRVFGPDDEELEGSPFTTNSEGVIFLSNLPVGNYRIQELSGYEITTPVFVDGFYTAAVAEDHQTGVYVGNLIPEVPNWNFTIYKFKDVEHLGFFDQGEDFLMGIQFELYDEWDDDEPIKSGFTDEDGRLVFQDLEAGTYYLRELSSNEITVPVFDEAHLFEFEVGEALPTEIWVGNYIEDDDDEDGSITIWKFDDENENGEWDDGEPALDDITFKLFVYPESEVVLYSASVLQTQPVEYMAGATNASGKLVFYDLPFGDYYLEEMSPYTITTPSALKEERMLISVTYNDPDRVVWVGNSDDSSIVVNKFLDENRNGRWDDEDPNEDALPGIRFHLYNTLNPEAMPIVSGTTDSYGKIEFTDLDPGRYYLVEDSDYSLTTHDTSDGIIDVGYLGINERLQVVVGNYMEEEEDHGTIVVHKFNDADRDGKKDENESWLSGVEFELFESMDDSQPLTSGTTNSSGMITFENLDPGDYYLDELGSRVVTTGTNSRGFIVVEDLDAGETLHEYVGNYRRTPPKDDDDDDDDETGMIRVHKFLDSDKDGSMDAKEFSMSGIRFELYDAEQEKIISTKSTDKEGVLTFSNLELGNYYLKEVSDYEITSKEFGTDGFTTVPIEVDSDDPIEFYVGNFRNVIEPVAAVQLPEATVVETVEEPVPLALPQTGELPPTQFYILGALLMLAGMFLKRFE